MTGMIKMFKLAQLLIYVFLLVCLLAFHFRYLPQLVLLNRSVLKWYDGVYSKGRFLVYDCTRPYCGGWADRLEGITSAYLISLATNRNFLLNLTYPVDIKGFLEPNEVNWVVDPEAIENKSSRLYSYMDNRNFIHSLQTMDFGSRHPEDVVRLKMNAINSHYIKKNAKYQKQLADFRSKRLSAVFSTIHNRLFSFSDELKLRLASFRASVGNTAVNRLVCAQIRVGYFGERSVFGKNANPDAFWTFLDDSRTDNNTRIFVSSDSPAIVNRAMRRYDWQAVRVPGYIDHIDKSDKKNVVEGFWKTLTDFYAMTTCDVLLLSQGSFGRLPAFLRGRDEGLYLLKNHKIVKVSLEDVETDYLEKVVF